MWRLEATAWDIQFVWPGSLDRSGGLPGEETALELRLEGRQRNKDPQKEAGLATVSAAGEARP